MAGIKMNVEFPTRLCEVNGKLGYFHRWEQWSKVVDASPLRGGHPGGQNGQVFGIVEFEDGVRRVGPSSIKFCDEENAILCEMAKHHEALRRGEANAEICETLKTLGRKAIAARNVLMGKKNVAENASKISALAPTISNS